MIKITATKLDGGTNILTVAVNGHVNSTSTPYGSAVISSTPDGPASFSSANCLKEVPQNSVFGSYSTSTSEGYSVTYSNGTEALFPLNSCPVPVTPDNYRIDSIIESNPEFIVAEDGSTYEGTNACNCVLGPNITNSTGAQWAVLNFILYGNQRTYPCGPGSYWTFNRLGLILVTIPINSTGGLQFSNVEIQSAPPDIFMCTTTTT